MEVDFIVYGAGGMDAIEDTNSARIRPEDLRGLKAVAAGWIDYLAMSAIRLSPLDNIVVLARSVPAGATIEVEGRTLEVALPLGLGHKLAFRPIAAGEKILKYGVAIGSATRAIAPGEHVHLHNMQSDYLPTFTLEDGRLFGGKR